ncbi:LacI family transcriptional regulator [Paraoerskovia sediminicola]|uniref:LacI family transcriptional regulator n=1 Tax=Paraoerskovia sediminicola TaxID=1138587 RepID=A0ABM8G033_9CELL|nr:LacI family DNA-binding transcriptional regulator [Paraoerskovia sediminicola]BDZ41348.1 LacI family transcriptional regulator [Paraoerskovia sediminicola]
MPTSKPTSPRSEHGGPPRRTAAVTLEDVARSAGVSRASASRVVNGKAGVDPEIVAAVRGAVGRLGYAPNQAARSLVTRRAGTVLVVVSGGGDDGPDGPWGPGQVLADPFFGRVIGGLMGSLQPRDVHPVLMVASSEVERERVLSYLREGRADGVLVVSGHAGDPLPGLLAASGVPTVLFSRPETPMRLSYVDVASEQGAALAVDRLVGRGCERIGIITGPLDVPGAEDRLAGFREAMARHGFGWAPVERGAFSLPSGRECMARLIEEHQVDGVFASNDYMAVGAVHAAVEAGLRVPDDVAVVGFDDAAPAVVCRPALTTVRQPVEEMAAEMARILLDLLADRTATPRSAIFDPVLVVRDSA